MKVEPGNILKLFLNFSNFEPQYFIKKKSVVDPRKLLLEFQSVLGTRGGREEALAQNSNVYISKYTVTLYTPLKKLSPFLNKSCRAHL